MTRTVLWRCDRGTLAKLEVLQGYLNAWFNILAAAGAKNVIYVDGFCGPGEYAGGEKGSPVAATEIAHLAIRRFPHLSVHILCIDIREDVLLHLRSLPAMQQQDPRLNISIQHGEFASEIARALQGETYQKQWPIFSFVDPFGFSGVSQSTLQMLMRNRSSEIFVNLWCGFMNRFIQHPEEEVRGGISDLIGGQNLDRVAQAENGISEICEIFSENLRELGPYVRRFMMRDENNTRDNALFFCGRHEKGLEKVKEAMWRVDPISGASFSEYGAQRTENTLPGLQEPQTVPLRHALLDTFSGRAGVSVSELIRWTIVSTDTFLPVHLRRELENLYRQGRLTYIDPAPTGRRRQRGHWPERLRISFPSE